jgi:hypothetical protein
MQAHLDERSVVSLITGVDMRFLENDADSGSVLGVSSSQLAVNRIVPVVVLLRILEDTGSKRVPNSSVRKENLRVKKINNSVMHLPFTGSTSYQMNICHFF